MVGTEVHFADGIIVDSRVDSEPYRAIWEVLEGCIESSALERCVLVDETSAALVYAT